MADIVKHGDRPRNTHTPPLPVKVKHRKQIAQGHRGQTWQWLPTGQEERVVTASGQTGALSPGISGQFASTKPEDATGAIVLITLSANTNTAGQVRGFILKDSGAVNSTDAALCLSQEMGNNSWGSKIIGPVPFVNGGLYWGTEIAGTVNYGFFVDIIGWVLE